MGSATISGKMHGFICLQRDETANVGSAGFEMLEEKLSRNFDCKPKNILEDKQSVLFSVANITKHRENFKATQDDHLERLSVLELTTATLANFVT